MDGGRHVDRDRCGAAADVRAAAMRATKPEDAGLTMASAMAKLFASEAANRAAYNALQIFGGHGYLTEHPVERYYPRCAGDDAVRGDIGDRATGNRARTGERMMNLELTDDQQLLRQAMREFAVGEIAPGAAERDDQARFPAELIPKLAEQGVLGIMVPEEYGGSGYDAVGDAIILEEVARVDAAVALLVGSHNSLCSGHILLAGTDEQKRTYLPPLAAGDKLGAWALTEPGSGSDAGAMRTRAMLDGDSWVIRGDKQFITQGSTAGTYVIMASTDPSQGTKGISAFIVDRETTGTGRREARKEAWRPGIGHGSIAFRRHAGAEGKSAWPK